MDVSKGYVDNKLLDAKGNVLDQPFVLDDNHKGHTKLKQYMVGLTAKYPDAEIRCGLESTGGYENNWYTMLYNLGAELPNVKVTRINPKAIYHGSEASMQKTKTDATSAHAIAMYMIKYPEKVVYNQADQHGNLEELKTTINVLTGTTKQSTQVKNQLQMLLYSAFSELLSVTKGSLSNWALTFLEYYPTAGSLADAKGKLKAIPYVKAEKLQKLRDSVCKNRVSSKDDEATRMSIRMLVRRYRNLEAEELELKKYLCKNIKSPTVDLLVTIPGIAEYSACHLLVAIGDVNRFATVEKMVAFFGLHPVVKESGDKKGKSRMSKSGDSKVRATLYMCATSAVRSNAHFKEIFARCKAKGMTYDQAIGVIMHKLCRICFGILKSGKPFDAAIDKANIDKSVDAQTKHEAQDMHGFTATKRRMQELTDDAPISKMHSKKRRQFLKQENKERSGVETMGNEKTKKERSHQKPQSANTPRTRSSDET